MIMATASETGHVKNVANFDELISKILGYGPDYNPTKTSLKTESLQSTSFIARKAIDAVNDLRTKNSAVLNANTPLNNARLSRNNILYNEVTGLVYTAMSAKAYIKSVFGATSPQYKQVSGLQLKMLKF